MKPKALRLLGSGISGVGFIGAIVGFRISGLGAIVGFRIEGLGFIVGFRVQGLGCRIQG